MPRGGKRQGTEGKTYGNRTDLQNALNQGDRKIPTPPKGAPAESNVQAVQRPQLSASDVPSLFAPDSYPDRPLTTGLSSGAGAGPEAMQAPPMLDDPAVADLRAVFLQYPYEGIRRLLDAYR